MALTPRLDRLFDAKHAPDPRSLLDLSARDLDDLTDIAAGRSIRRGRTEALHLLARREPARALSPLAELLRQADADAGLRAQAAAALGRIDSDEADAALVAGLDAGGGPLVRGRIAQALGRVGLARSRGALDALASDPTPHVREQGQFARTVVACRLGLPWPMPQPPDPDDLLPEPDAAHRLAVRAASDAETRVAIDRLGGDLWRTPLATSGAVRTDCQGRVLIVARSAAIGVGAEEQARAIARSPRLVALVIGGYSQEGVTDVDWLVLSWPLPNDHVVVSVYTPRGARVWAGVGGPSWPMQGLGLRSVKGHHHPIVSLTLQFAASALTIDNVRVADARPSIGKRRPGADVL